MNLKNEKERKKAHKKIYSQGWYEVEPTQVNQQKQQQNALQKGGKFYNETPKKKCLKMFFFVFVIAKFSSQTYMM